MSARINGAVVVTNPRPLHASNGDDNKSRHLLLDAHFFLSDGSELTVLLKYFNENKMLLHDPDDPDAGVVVVLEATVVRMSAEAHIEGSDLTQDELCEYQLYGDVAWIYPCNIDPRIPPYIHAIGAAGSVERDIATFNIDANQWSPVYPRNHPSASLPLRVLVPTSKRFPDPKKICPSNQQWTYVAGRPTKFSLKDRYLDRLDLDLNAIAYMGKHVPPYNPSQGILLHTFFAAAPLSSLPPQALCKTPDGPSSAKRKRFNFGKFDDAPETPVRKRPRCDDSFASDCTVLESSSS
ncbi:hypothetical protein EYR38_001557 [Pleurotus pulmonarius]|nr:hypothetical protein EYR38_001557 [Pleurotus pulmonarius]